MDDPPYDRIEVREDGYLWLVNFTPDDTTVGEEIQPLLLHSAAALLGQLQEKWHENAVLEEEGDVTMQDAVEDIDNSDQPETAADASDEESTTEEAGENDDNTNNHETTKIIDSKNSQKRKKKADESTALSASKYKHLERTTNLGDRILVALMHVRLFKHDGRKKRRVKEDRRETKVKALQHQRDRLQKQKEQQKQQEEEQQQQLLQVDQTTTTTTPVEGDQRNSDDSDFQVVGKQDDTNNNSNKSDDNESVSSTVEAPQHPYVRLVRTLNSLRALTPILRALLLHPDKETKDLRVGRKNTRLPNKKKKEWWLLGNHVFDIVGASSCQTIAMHLQDLLECFLPSQEALDVLGGTPEVEQEFWRQTWLSRVWVPTQPASSILLASPMIILKDYIFENSDAGTNTNANADDGIVRTRAMEAICKACDNRFFQSKKDTGEKHRGGAQQKAAAEQKQYEQAVQRLHSRLAHLLLKEFRGARLSVYGSCLSNLSLKASDVDLSLYLPEAERAKRSFQNGTWSPSRYEKEMSKLVREVWRKLMYRKAEYANMVPVTRARVPVVKGCYLKANNPHTPDGSLDFDICFLNDIAVANSSLLREYSLMDESVRELMIVVKKWAKYNNICSAQDNSPSSYAWMCMVVFYLQCINFVPNLQCPTLMEKAGVQRDSKEYWHNVNDLDTCYLTWEQVQQVWKRPEGFEFSISSLLFGFFHFYAIDFTRSVSMISIKRGREEVLPKTVFRKCSAFFCIEDPFETFDSHMPHDLGIPVNEFQCHRIFDLLQRGEEHLRTILLGLDDDDGDEETTLWPTIEATKTDKAGGGKKGKKKKRKAKGGRGHGGGSGDGPVDQKQPQAKKEGNNNQTAQKQQPAQKRPGRGGPSQGNKHNKNGGPTNAPKGKGPTQATGQETKGPKSRHHVGKNAGAGKGAGNDNVANGEGNKAASTDKKSGKGGGGGGGRRQGGRNGKRGGGKKQQHQTDQKD